MIVQKRKMELDAIAFSPVVFHLMGSPPLSRCSAASSGSGFKEKTMESCDSHKHQLNWHTTSNLALSSCLMVS